jgi:DUF4097 and DUF4098 domain-containing protein YvlB
MRRRSMAGPLVLILIGVLFLWNNIRPDVPVFELISVYWPFFLIAWGVLRLVEVLASAAASKPLPRGMSGGEVVLVIFICLIGSGFFTATRHGWRFAPRSLDILGEQYDYPVTFQAPAANARTVVFDGMRGNLRITGGDVQEIRITGRKTVRAFRKPDADQANQNTPVEVATEGDRLVVHTNQDRISGDRRITEDLEVTIPRAVNVETRQRSGDLDITDLGGNVDASSDRSDVRLLRIGGNARLELRRSALIRVVAVKGTVELQGRGADVELENIGGPVTINGGYSGTLDFKNLAKPLRFESQNTDLRVEAVPGRINMDLSELSAKNLVGPIWLKTKSKDVKMEDFTQSIEIETERGDIELQPVRVPLAKIEARSRTGKIQLVLPEKAGFQLHATTEHGEALNDFGPPIHQEREGRSASLKGSVGSGASITVSTERGTVTVRKANAAAALSTEKF